jgi:hypothetical protein
VLEFRGILLHFPSLANSRDRNQVVGDDTPTDISLEATIALIPRTRHAEAVF